MRALSVFILSMAIASTGEPLKALDFSAYGYESTVLMSDGWVYEWGGSTNALRPIRKLQAGVNAKLAINNKERLVIDSVGNTFSWPYSGNTSCGYFYTWIPLVSSASMCSGHYLHMDLSDNYTTAIDDLGHLVGKARGNFREEIPRLRNPNFLNSLDSSRVYTQVTVGDAFVFALDLNGHLYGSGQGVDTAFRAVGEPSDLWIKIRAASQTLVALRSDSTLWNFFPDSAQIGTEKWLDFDVGYRWVMAIRSDSTLWYWPTEIAEPIQSDHKWIRIEAGVDHGLAIDSAGTLWSFGRNHTGQLGIGTSLDAYNWEPQQVQGLINPPLAKALDTLVILKGDQDLVVPWSQLFHFSHGDPATFSASIIRGASAISLEYDQSNLTIHQQTSDSIMGTIRLQVNDGTNTLNTDWSILINHAPIKVDSGYPDLTLIEDFGVYQITAHSSWVTDANGDVLSVSLQSLNGSSVGTWHQSNSYLLINSVSGQTGTSQAIIKVTDRHGAWILDTITITVNPRVKTPPSPQITSVIGPQIFSYAEDFRGRAMIDSDHNLWLSMFNIFNSKLLDAPLKIDSSGTWSSVAISDNKILLLKKDSSLWEISSNTPLKKIDDYKYSKVRNGYYGNYGALTYDSTLYLWGYSTNDPGCLMPLFHLGSIIPTPTAIPGKWIDFFIDNQSQSCYAIATDSSLWAWGYGHTTYQPITQHRTLGLKGLAFSIIPTQISKNKWKKVAPSYFASYGIKADSSLWAWGDMTMVPTLSTTTFSDEPISVSSEKWIDVSAFHRCLLALRADSTLWTCGSCADMQVGWRQISQEKFTNLEGWRAARTIDGSIRELYFTQNWGSSAMVVERPTLVSSSKWISIDISKNNTSPISMGVQKDSTLWTWGWGKSGESGQPFMDIMTRPQQISGRGWSSHRTQIYDFSLPAVWKTDRQSYSEMYNYYPYFSTGSAFPFQAIHSAGTYYPNSTYTNTFWLDIDHNLWAIGNNSKAQFGNGNRSALGTITKIGSDQWLDISTDQSISLRIRSDSTLWITGDSSFKFLTTGSPSLVPIQLGTAKYLDVEIKKISESLSIALAIDHQGLLWELGKPSNKLRQLGTSHWIRLKVDHEQLLLMCSDSTWWQYNDSALIQISNQPWLDLSKRNDGYAYTLAIAPDSSLWAWGDNSMGQLGLGWSALGADLMRPIFGITTSQDTFNIPVLPPLRLPEVHPLASLKSNDYYKSSSPVQIVRAESLNSELTLTIKSDTLIVVANQIFEDTISVVVYLMNQSGAFTKDTLDLVIDHIPTTTLPDTLKFPFDYSMQNLDLNQWFTDERLSLLNYTSLNLSSTLFNALITEQKLQLNSIGGTCGLDSLQLKATDDLGMTVNTQLYIQVQCEGPVTKTPLTRIIRQKQFRSYNLLGQRN